MGIYKIRVRGDTYGEYDGEVLVESTEKIPALNKDLLLEYKGKLDIIELLLPYINPEIPQYIAYKISGMKTPKEYFVKKGKYNPAIFVPKISTSVDVLKKATIKARKSEISALKFKTSKDNWNCISTIEDLEWDIEDNMPHINDIRNGISIFNNSDYSFIVFTECGIAIEKILRDKDRESLLKKGEQD